MKKTDSKRKEDSGELVAAIVMPLETRTDDEVVEFLTENGAQHVKRLAPGFLSVEATQNLLKSAEALARIEPKTKKQLH